MNRLTLAMLALHAILLFGCPESTRPGGAPQAPADRAGEHAASEPESGPAGEQGAPASDAARGCARPPKPAAAQPSLPATSLADSYAGPCVADGVDLTATREIVGPGCTPKRYSDAFTIEPGTTCSGRACGPGIECTRAADCTRQPHGACRAFVQGQCDYGQGPDGVGCLSDDECTAQAGGRCAGTIYQTLCRYGSNCASHEECGPRGRCECDGSLWRCVQADCLQDADCPSGQRCFRSNPCNYGPIGDYRCTTPVDECVPYAKDGCACDYALDERRWKCTDIICD